MTMSRRHVAFYWSCSAVRAARRSSRACLRAARAARHAATAERRALPWRVPSGHRCGPAPACRCPVRPGSGPTARWCPRPWLISRALPSCRNGGAGHGFYIVIHVA
ncbi:hypothetical protein RAA17_21170 [Komagataeibacter rhaeticus]|nr:hypothetical protein [Komagataeibacter rhaeticus]